MKNVKDAIVAIALILAFVILVAIKGIYFPDNREEVGCVTGVTGDIVTVVTEDGHVWRFEGDGYHVNDMVELTIYDRDTAEVGDDVIMDVEML